MTEQFAINLKIHDGQMGNFFAYGAFERMISCGNRLVHRIEHDSGCILVMERTRTIPFVGASTFPPETILLA